jgi:hypothetical protein
MSRPQRINCLTCHGHGLVCDYRGSDFNGADPCPDCGGTGSVTVYGSGRLAAYPGGPFVGSLSKRDLDAARTGAGEGQDA